MLREQLVAEEAKLKRAELELLEMREVQARAAGMEHQLQLWQAATEARLPEQLTQLVVDLQRQCLGAKEQLGQKDAQLAAAKGRLGNGSVHAPGLHTAAGEGARRKPVHAQSTGGIST